MDEASRHSNTCPFCLPETQRNAFANSESFLALYNNAPVLPGHTLIIPRVHIESLRSIPDNLITEFFLFARDVTEMLLGHYHADAFDWSIQDNKAAGQTVPHLHLHIVIRHPDDLPEPGDWYPLLDAQRKTDNETRPKLSTTEYTEITEQLRSAYSLYRKQGGIRSL